MCGMRSENSMTGYTGNVDPLARYYAERAAEYEQVYEKPERQEDLHALRSLVSTAFKGRNVLELACGTGYWTQFIASAATSIVATDLNTEVLAIARSKPMGSCRMEFRQDDAYSPNPSSPPEHLHIGKSRGGWRTKKRRSKWHFVC